MKQIQYTALVYFFALVLCLIVSVGCGNEDGLQFYSHCYDSEGAPYEVIDERGCYK